VFGTWRKKAFEFVFRCVLVRLGLCFSTIGEKQKIFGIWYDGVFRTRCSVEYYFHTIGQGGRKPCATTASLSYSTRTAKWKRWSTLKGKSFLSLSFFVVREVLFCNVIRVSPSAQFSVPASWEHSLVVRRSLPCSEHSLSFVPWALSPCILWLSQPHVSSGSRWPNWARTMLSNPASLIVSRCRVCALYVFFVAFTYEPVLVPTFVTSCCFEVALSSNVCRLLLSSSVRFWGVVRVTNFFCYLFFIRLHACLFAEELTLCPSSSGWKMFPLCFVPRPWLCPCSPCEYVHSLSSHD